MVSRNSERKFNADLNGVNCNSPSLKLIQIFLNYNTFGQYFQHFWKFFFRHFKHKNVTVQPYWGPWRYLDMTTGFSVFKNQINIMWLIVYVPFLIIFYQWFKLYFKPKILQYSHNEIINDNFDMTMWLPCRKAKGPITCCYT